MFRGLSMVNAQPSTAMSCVAQQKYSIKKQTVRGTTSGLAGSPFLSSLQNAMTSSEERTSAEAEGYRIESVAIHQ